MDDAVFEVFALKFAEHPGAPRAAFFFGPVAEAPESTLELDYYFWLVRSGDEVVLVDIGFTEETAKRRGRPYQRSPEEALRALGIAPGDVTLVILSHLHYDHAGCWEPFSSARFVLQDDEMAFWAGRNLSRGAFRWLIEPDDLHAFLRMNYEGRIHWVEGDAQLAGGLSVHRVGGHSPGSQIVRVRTREGWMVLASDSAPTYEHYESKTPFGILTDVPGCYRAFDRIEELADSSALVVPGHDREVLRRFDVVAGQGNLTVRLA